MVPQRAELFLVLVVGGEASVVVVPEFAGIDPVLRIAVALGCGVPVVQVCSDRREPESDVVLREIVAHAHQSGLAVSRVNRRARKDATVTPDQVRRQLGMKIVRGLLHVDVIKNLGSEFGVALVVGWIRRRVQPVGRFRLRHDREGLHKRSDGRTDRRQRNDGR